jgi:hypothetical protein
MIGIGCMIQSNLARQRYSHLEYKKVGSEERVRKIFLLMLAAKKRSVVDLIISSLIEGNAKCRHLKFTCKETLRQVFINVYRLEIQSVMLVFLTQLCELLPL